MRPFKPHSKESRGVLGPIGHASKLAGKHLEGSRSHALYGLVHCYLMFREFSWQHLEYP